MATTTTSESRSAPLVIRAQHTPGPWIAKGHVKEVGGYGDFYCADIRADDWRGPIAMIQSCDHIRGVTREEAKANARLIAAAPDLLAALRQMVVNSDGDGKSYRDCHVKALAAIAKATGAF